MSKLMLAVLLWLPLNLPAQVDPDYYIYPNPSQKFILVRSIPGEQEQLTGRFINQQDQLYQTVMHDMDYPFHQQINRVNQCVRNLAGNTEGPNILLLSGNEGGFPRQGITLISPDGDTAQYPDLHFADLVLDVQRVERGDLSIYSHEMGHVLMNMILTDYWDRFPNPTSPKQHVSMGVTDYLTAFYEGWGVHFQRLAYDNEDPYRKAFHSLYSPSRGVTAAWHSNLDESLRILDVENMNYIYEKVLPAGINPDTLSLEEQILLEHTSTLFDPTRIKTAQQMLSCEGVLAAIMYHITSNPVLQNNYRELDFYRPFLVRYPENNIPANALFTPLENVLMKSVKVWSEMNQTEQPFNPMTDFIQTWCQIFPEDKQEMIKTFVFVTKGKTMNNQLSKLTEQVNYYGQLGDIMKFRELASQWSEEYKSCITQAVENPEVLTQNVGPELWKIHPDIKIRRTLWMAEPKGKLAVNMNTASWYELSAFMTADQANELLIKRRTKGFLTEEDLAGLF